MDISTTYLGLKLNSPLIAGSSGLTGSVDKIKALAHHGAGVGDAPVLDDAATAEARELGARGVLLQVHEDNSPALHLYTSLGFQ